MSEAPGTELMQADPVPDPADLSWLDQLQPASWRNIPFAVMDSEIRRGRRVAVHEYPFRDIVWVEDLGRATRRYGLRGFYVGDDCYAVERAMLDAAETAGTGDLVHPSLGRLTVTLVEFSSGQRRELGRVVEFQFGFIEGAPGTVFPSAADSTQNMADDAADDADDASAGDFGDQVAGAFSTGAAALGEAIGTVQSVINDGLAVVHDAARLVNSVNGLASLASFAVSLGRYSDGNLLPFGALQAVIAPALAIASTLGRVELGAQLAIANAITLGTAVVDAGSELVGLATGLGEGNTDSFITGLQTFTESVRLASNNPADAVRLLSAMATFDTTPVLGATAIPAAMETVRGGITAAGRRAALTSLARACADYLPTSSDDAQALRSSVAALYDAEILRTADAGLPRSYLALRTLRTSVVVDLTTRGAALAPLTQVVTKQSLPALVLAQMLYQDATRTVELIAGAGDVPAPLFMPTSFPALAS